MPGRPPSRLATVLLTAGTLACFAANSLLCRRALAAHEIDPAGFTALRLGSGALALLLLTRASGLRVAGGWAQGLTLFLYAVPFSLAYLSVGAGVGSLIIFGAVQLTMFGGSMIQGERPAPLVWLGLALSLGGLAALTLPGAGSPPLAGAALMAVAGGAWGVYSLQGRAQGADPVAASAGAFLRAAPFALLLAAAVGLGGGLHATPRGLGLGLASGVLASAGGYVLWYRTLPRLSAPTAGVVQLLVPVLTGLGATALLGELPSVRLLAAGAAILGGVVLAVLGRRR